MPPPSEIPIVNSCPSGVQVERDESQRLLNQKTATISGEAPPPIELKRRTVRGALVSFVCQATGFILRLGSMIVLARLLTPKDFGLVGMVTAMTGFLSLFREAGLSTAAIQSATVNDSQLSTLFWLNVLIGCVLGLLCMLSAPLVVAFYGEPQLLWITVAMGSTFFFTGLAAQHRAILLRSLQFLKVGVVETLALVLSIIISIIMAALGCGYWALLANVVVLPAASAAGVWIASRWVPGRPRGMADVRNMIAYGGTVTLNGVVVYLAYNVEKVLLGRFWGAEALGIYGRAYQLINLPTENLQSSLGAVVFPALSRVQEDPIRFRNFFLRAYSLFLSIALPLTFACAIFAEDILLVFLGPQWHEAVPVFRLLAPTILAFALINPVAWLMYANGRVVRSLWIAVMIAPVVILGIVLGLNKGPTGVAIGFSSAMVLLVLPVIFWATRGTLITVPDTLKTALRPLGAALFGLVAAIGAQPWISHVEPPLLRLTLESALLFGVYSIILLFVFGQKPVYIDLFKQAGLWRTPNRQNSDKSS